MTELNAEKTKQIFEEYEYQGWLIQIQNYFGTEELQAFAIPSKYSHITNIDNYQWDTEKEHGMIYDYEKDEYLKPYQDYGYIIAEPDDYLVKCCTNVKSSTSMLSYCVNKIIHTLDINPPKTIVLKEIYKKTNYAKVSNNKRGFLHQAWAALVKERDKKCTLCGSFYDLHAHHIKAYKDAPKERHSVNNGITLCANCHRDWHKKNGR